MAANPEVNNFAKELDLQLLRSEKQRVSILGIIFLAGMIIATGRVALVRGRIEGIDTVFLYLPIAGFFLGVIFEFSLYVLIRNRLKQNRLMPAWLYTISFVIDLVFPVILLFSLMHILGPFLGLGSSASYVFFIFIILSVLRLHFWPSVITGAVSALSYSGMVFFGLWLERESFPDEVLQNTIYLFNRSFIMLLAGIMVGFIANQIRKRTEDALAHFHEKEKILDTFGQHVSPEVVNQLMNQSYEIESRDVTIMFLDIRNFTAYSEQRSPVEVIGRLNEVFAFMIDIINRNNGIINKFLGDGFMAVFGAPIQKGNNEQNALHAATQIIEELDRRKNTYSEDAFEVGIGIHSGEAVTGTVGSPARKEYTIIGDVVNLTARLEALNKKFNTRVLITDRVYKAAGMPGLQAEKMPEVQVKGRKELLQTYRLF